MPLDETLLAPRRVLSCQPDDDGLGFAIDLACGHTVWMAIAITVYQSLHCGVCLNALVEQCREVQARQRVG
jgi:hypothetical protein